MMYIIFVFSSQEADLSSSISHRVSVVIVKGTDYVFDLDLDDWKIEEYAGRIHGVTRKLAHMAEYFLLAVAVSFPLYVYGLHGLLLVLVAGVICVGYACTDEYHQAFVAGRAASWKDVGIDSVGVLIGIILVRIIGWTGRHTIFRPLPSDRYGRQNRKEINRLKKQQRRMQRQMEKESRRRNIPASDPYDHSPYYDPYNKEETGSYPRSDPSNDDRYMPGRYGNPGRYEGKDGYGRYDGYDRFDEYDGYDDPEEDISSDDLADDMPLSGIFQNKKRRK